MSVFSLSFRSIHVQPHAILQVFLFLCSKPDVISSEADYWHVCPVPGSEEGDLSSVLCRRSLGKTLEILFFIARSLS